MKKTIIILRFISLFGIYYVEQYRVTPSLTISSNTNLEKIGTLNNFYEYSLKSVLGNSKQIGYKQEKLSKVSGGFAYKFSMVFDIASITKVSGLANMKGEIYFDANGIIQSLDILIMDSFLISGQRGDGESKILIEMKQLPITASSFNQNKLFDLNDINFDLFLIKSLPFQNLQDGNVYEYSYLAPNITLKGYDLKTVEIKVTKKDKNTYWINQRVFGQDIRNILTFDDSGNLIKESNGILSSRLVTNQRLINSIINRFSGVNSSNNTNKRVLTGDNNQINNNENQIKTDINSLTGTQVAQPEISDIGNINIDDIVKQINNQLSSQCSLLPLKNK